MMRSFQRIVLTVLLISGSLRPWAQTPPAPFRLAGHTVEPGTVSSFSIPVNAPSGDSTYIPVTVINGSKPGPVLGLMAGVHGSEYPPIIALQQLKPLLHPARISGTVVLVHIANVNAFFGRSVYVNPADRKNLNRTFPGKPDGTITECLAWTISRTILPSFHYFVDVHAGDANENLHPYVGYVVHGQQTAVARKMAMATGFNWVMRAERNLSDSQPTMYTTSEAIAQGIPAIAIECGERGRVTNAETERINKGLLNLMRTLQILDGKPLVPAGATKEITKRFSIYSEHTGIFYSNCSSGQQVRKGSKLGYLTDVYGRHLQDIMAPEDGVIVYMMGTPPVSKSEVLFNFAVLPGGR